MRELIMNAISSYKEEIVDFTRRLIAIPTENPPGKKYAACVEVIAEELQRIGLSPEVLEIPGERARCDSAGDRRLEEGPPRCVRSFYGTGEQTLYFHGHYDVVPATSAEQFLPRRKGVKLYGRGSSDMKGGLAAMIYAVRAIKDCNGELDGRLGLMIVPDEETGGARGSGSLAKVGILGENGIGMLTPEPSSGILWNASRGALSLRITVKGKPAHVGLHFKGSNAFEGMMAVANRLLELKHEVEARKTSFRIAPEPARRSILLLGGKCSGGTNFNVVPDEMSFTIDRRINPEEDLEEEKGRLLTCFEELTRGGIDLEVEVLQEGCAAGFSEDEALARALAKNVATVTGKPPKFELCPGLLEIRYYAEKGVPALAYGPGRLSVSHGPHEFVSIKDICDCTMVYALTAVDLMAR